MPDTAQAQDYQKLLSDVLQKQITILGRQITLLKARKVAGLKVNDDGHVTEITGDPKEIINQLLQEFRELSSPLVKKTMQPLLQIVIPADTNASVDQTSQSANKPLPDLHSHGEQPQQQTEPEVIPNHEQVQGKEEGQAPHA
jgi:hypothetical protein